MQGDGQLDDTQRGAEMTPRRGHRADDRVADLGGQARELDLVQTTQVGRALELGKDVHGRRFASGCASLGWLRVAVIINLFLLSRQFRRVGTSGRD
jgi:hypothetical protein